MIETISLCKTIAILVCQQISSKTYKMQSSTNCEQEMTNDKMWAVI